MWILINNFARGFILFIVGTISAIFIDRLFDNVEYRIHQTSSLFIIGELIIQLFLNLVAAYYAIKLAYSLPTLSYILTKHKTVANESISTIISIFFMSVIFKMNENLEIKLSYMRNLFYPDPDKHKKNLK